MRKGIALTALAMVPFSVSHANEAELLGIITSETLNVRSGAGSNFEVLYMVKKNDKVTVTDTSNGWYKVKNSEDKEGWVSSKYVSISESSETVSRSSSYDQKEVNTNGLNMRSGAGTSYRVITTLNKGTKVDVISESNGWSKIKYDGRLGYVYSTYLDNIKPSYTNTTTKIVNTDSLNVRSGPSTSNTIVGKLSKGTKVSVISESNGWSKILYNNKECYVSSRYLNSGSSSSDNSNNNSSNNTVKETKEVNTDSLNVRSGPSTSHSKIGTLSKGTKVSVISESNGWSKILYNNKEAYVSSQYLSKISSGSTGDNTSSNTVKETKEVNTDSLNVRRGPSTSHSKIGTLSKGTKVSVISESN
ncbi:SH3 domain-containing protein, partial [Romboutsia ilealis]|nr:SH3 domain-containing protein [Romboutsia ilealis]